jgi:hypothetical protein
MPPAVPNYIPSVRALQLAARLRTHREKTAKLSQSAAAASLGWTQQKVSLLETARRRADERDVALMLRLYGVCSPERDELLALARDSDQRNWWSDFSDVFTGPFVALEDAAVRINEWQPQVIPGLLQTDAYAREIIAAGRFGEEDVERRLAARMARQSILSRPNAPHLHVVLDEAVLERPVGGEEVMRDQMYKLAGDARRSNVTIQVLPKSVGTHAGFEGLFLIFGFAEPAQPDVAYTEGFFGAVYLESRPQVTRCSVAFERLREAALSPDESAAFIDAAAKK